MSILEVVTPRPELMELELAENQYRLRPWRLSTTPGNIYFAGEMGMESLFDRVLVIEDDFRSGYECDTCKQTGKVLCDNCRGEGNRTSVSPSSGTTIKIKCSHCDGTGQIVCADCNGKGELLVIPEVAKRRPTTGQVVSVGCDVKGIKLGDFVAYPNFCGEVWDLSGVDHEGIERTIVMRIMKERECICKVTGHLSLRRMKNRQSQISG